MARFLDSALRAPWRPPEGHCFCATAVARRGAHQGDTVPVQLQSSNRAERCSYSVACLRLASCLFEVVAFAWRRRLLCVFFCCSPRPARSALAMLVPLGGAADHTAAVGCSGFRPCWRFFVFSALCAAALPPSFLARLRRLVFYSSARSTQPGPTPQNKQGPRGWLLLNVGSS